MHNNLIILISSCSFFISIYLKVHLMLCNCAILHDENVLVNLKLKYTCFSKFELS